MSEEAKKWAMACHLGGLAGLTCIPFANIILPLIFWQIKKDMDPFVDDQGKEAVNFQLTVTIAGLINTALTFIIPIVPIFIGMGIFIVYIVFTILGGLAAGKGETYRYPYTLRLIK